MYKKSFYLSFTYLVVYVGIGGLLVVLTLASLGHHNFGPENAGQP